MRPLSSRKIGNLRSGMRLVASERPEILQIGSLARWKRIFPAIFGGRVVRLLGLASAPKPKSPGDSFDESDCWVIAGWLLGDCYSFFSPPRRPFETRIAPK